MTPGRVFWVTGLSGAGKTTFCHALVAALRQAGRPVVMFDGDELRAVMDATAAHTRTERLALARRYARLCRTVASQGVDVAIATISLFGEVHAWNRENLPGYVEVFLDVPLEELARRDPKGIYQQGRAGRQDNIAGLDFAVDFPTAPHLHLVWSPAQSQEAAISTAVARLLEAFPPPTMAAGDKTEQDHRTEGKDPQ